MAAERLSAVITGASSGIGTEFARLLAKAAKYDLVLVARRKDRLESLKLELESQLARISEEHRPKVSIIPADLSEESGRDFLVKQLELQDSRVHLLINNAGFGSYGSFLEREREREMQMLRLNCMAPLDLSHRLLPKMLERGAGEIINVCSTASFMPIPYMATYAATKSFLLEFSLALREEVRKRGVNVLAHCPGPTYSEFHLAAGLGEKLNHLPTMNADVVAEEALEASRRGRALLVNGITNKCVVLLSRILPPQIVALVVGRRIGAVVGRPAH